MHFTISHCAGLSVIAFLTVGLAGVATVPAYGQQRPRVTQDAVTIRSFRLTQEHLTKLRQVSQTMARDYKPHPEAPRADVAMFAVLSMPLAFSEPLSDRTLTQTVGLIESGHANLFSAIRAAGLTTSDYVLAQITLLLAYPIVAAEKAGRPQTPTDETAVENVTFVRRHWAEIEAILRDLSPTGDNDTEASIH